MKKIFLLIITIMILSSSSLYENLPIVINPTIGFTELSKDVFNVKTPIIKEIKLGSNFQWREL